MDRQTSRICVCVVGALAVLAFVTMAILSIRAGNSSAEEAYIGGVCTQALTLLAAAWQPGERGPAPLPNPPAAQPGTEDAGDAPAK